MFRLVFIRHGEAAGAGNRDDHSRTLTQNGRSKVARQAALLKEKNIQPQQIMTSNSSRTLETCSIIKEEFKGCHSKASKGLYLAGFDGLLAELAEVDLLEGTIFLIGHNPGWSDIATQLTGTPVGLSPGDFCSCLYEGDSPLNTAITEIGGWRREAV